MENKEEAYQNEQVLTFVILSKAKNLESSYFCIEILHSVQDDIAG